MVTARASAVGFGVTNPPELTDSPRRPANVANKMEKEILTWIGIAFCLSQSAMFSGLNLAFFGISRLRLEVEADSGNKRAANLLEMRKDSNFLLTTILWGNVGVNCLLTILSDNVMAGAGAFFFSTIIITILGEIVPQAYFSRHAQLVANLLGPVLRFYQFLLYPVAKTSAVVLDKWLGQEGIPFYQERHFKDLIRKHVDAQESDVSKLEGTGAINFLALDDIPIGREGEPVDPKSVIRVEVENGRPRFPLFEHTPDDPFVKQILDADRPWVIFTDEQDKPLLVLDSDKFIRDIFRAKTRIGIWHLCHRPIIFTDMKTPLGHAMERFKFQPEHPEDDVIDDDIIIVWGEQRRVITGADIFGRLMRGIAHAEKAAKQAAAK